MLQPCFRCVSENKGEMIGWAGNYLGQNVKKKAAFHENTREIEKLEL